MRKNINKILSVLLIAFLLLSSRSFADENILKSWDEEIIYMVMTDRFFDGDPTNNNPENIEGSFDKDHLEAYHGGDFRGIIDKVDYLKDLGITTLWITPIVKNIDTNMMADKNDKQFAYHGYWASDFTKIDPHLGSEEDLKELIDVLHANGMKLMVDVVINHSGYGTKNIGDFAGMHRQESGAGDIETELAGLPDFKTEDEEVRDKIINWQVDWLKKFKTDKGNTIDYFRVDTVKNVDQDTMKDFKAALIKENPEFKMIGENFGASIFKDGGYLDPTMLDSLLDFEFKELAKDFVSGKISETEKRLVKRNKAISEEREMGQFLSSHDENGFLKVRLSDDLGKFLVASSLQLTAKGQPVIYYDEEIGQSGKKDNFDKGIYSENRYDFDWDKIENNEILDHYKKMLKIRNAFADVFAKGDRENLYMDDEVSIFQRSYGDKKVLVGLNTSEEAKEISFNFDTSEKMLDLYGKAKIKNKTGKISLTIPSRNEGGTVVLAQESINPEGFKVENKALNFGITYMLGGLVGLVLVVILIVKIKTNKKELD